jgi:hypothetical protein
VRVLLVHTAAVVEIDDGTIEAMAEHAGLTTDEVRAQLQQINDLAEKYTEADSRLASSYERLDRIYSEMPNHADESVRH